MPTTAESIYKEVKYLLLPLLLLLVLSFYLAFATREELKAIWDTKMTYRQVSMYLWLVCVFLITLCRQIRLRFNKFYPNLILVLTGLFLCLYFNAFAENSHLRRLTIQNNKITYETNDFTLETAFYRSLQILVFAVIIYCIFKLIKSKKGVTV